MSKAQSVHRPGTTSLWPWVVVAFLLGFAVSILMPPLLLVLIVALSTWGLVQWGHPPSANRDLLAYGNYPPDRVLNRSISYTVVGRRVG